MILEYKFEYVSNNSTYLAILENILKKEELEFKLYKEQNLILLYIIGEEERLLEISQHLSAKLPMSIFLKNFSLEVVLQLPKTKELQNIKSDNFYYTQECFEKLVLAKERSYYNPFFTCESSGTECDEMSLTLYKANEKQSFKNNKELFFKVASILKDKKRVKIKSSSGSFVFYNSTTLDYSNNILAINVENLPLYAVCSKEQAAALLSLEKPSINLRINEVFKAKLENSVENIWVRSSNDLITQLLSLELNALNLDFISYKEDDIFDYELSYDGSLAYIDIPKISIYENKTIVLESKVYDRSLNEIYNSYKVPSLAQFNVLLHENELLEKSILNIYTSSNNEDMISLYSPKIDGNIEILHLKKILSISDIFNEIKKSDGGVRLLNNFENKYPSLYKKVLNKKLNNQKGSVSSYWEVVCIILDLDLSDEKDLLSLASSSLLDKGPRIDYKLYDSNKIFNKEFNLVKFIKSGISFKLAGVEDKTIALGYIESFAYFLANLSDDVNSEFELDGIGICGDLYTNELFYNLLHKAITKNFKLYYNKDFPIKRD